MATNPFSAEAENEALKANATDRSTPLNTMDFTFRFVADGLTHIRDGGHLYHAPTTPKRSSGEGSAEDISAGTDMAQIWEQTSESDG